jgi:hypothetical protein
MADVRNPTSQATPISPARAEILSSEAVLNALKMILIGATLKEVLTSVTRLIETHCEGMLCSIFLLEDDGLHLRYGVAPNVSESYRAATDGLRIGPTAGSCGTAAYLRQSVFVADIASDPKWANPTTAATLRERNCLWMVASHRCRRRMGDRPVS